MYETSAKERMVAALAFANTPGWRLYSYAWSNMRDGICVACRGPAFQFSDELSKKEWGISGLCQRCQDKVFCADDTWYDDDEGAF